MIAQVQIEAQSSPIMTSLTTQPACMNSAQIDKCAAGSASAMFSMVQVLKIFRASLAAGPWASLVVRSRLACGFPQNAPLAAFSGQILVKGRRTDSSNLHQSLHEPLWLRMG